MPVRTAVTAAAARPATVVPTTPAAVTPLTRRPAATTAARPAAPPAAVLAATLAWRPTRNQVGPMEAASVGAVVPAAMVAPVSRTSGAAASSLRAPASSMNAATAAVLDTVVAHF